MVDNHLTALLWWPHSGGRWLSRSILGATHSFTHPWIFYSSDMTLALDITEQVHKARSLPELQDHLNALKESTDHGRAEGLRKYFSSFKVSSLVGEMCMGNPIPRPPDLETILTVAPNLRILHLVRDPRTAFPSFKNRLELDGDPIKVAASWLSCQAIVRKYFEARHSDRYKMIRYEDIPSNLDEICAFCGIKRTRQMLENSHKRWGKGTTELATDHEQSLIEEIAGPEMKHYGYDH